MLTLSKQTDYALLALTALVRREREVGIGGALHPALPAKEIAEAHGIPMEFLAKVLQKLAKAGLVVSSFGPTGGYRLAAPPESVKVGRVIEIIDGGLALAQCMRIIDNGCEQSSRCTIRGPLTRINEEIFRVLNTLTLDQITDPDPAADLVQIASPAGFRRVELAESEPAGGSAR